MNQIFTWQKNPFLVSTDKALLQIEKIHEFLSQQAYWSLGIPKEIVEKAIENSLCFGLYDQSDAQTLQIGFARVITDGATFAWICDVYVEPDFRGIGLSKWLLESLMSHPTLKGLRRVCLATKDAHSLYEKTGFKVTASPQNFMEIKDNDIYNKVL